MDRKFILNGETFLSKECVLEMFGVSYVTLWTWIKKGILRRHYLGKNIIFLEKELNEDIKNNKGFLKRSSYKRDLEKQK